MIFDKMKKLRLFGIVVGIVLVLELAARLYLFAGIPAEDRPLGFEKVKLFLSGGSYVCEFRGRRYLFQKPKGVYRILAIGGSTTAGVRGDKETWPYKLARRLNQSAKNGVRYEVINLGKCGATSTHERYYLLSQAYLDPDLVILYEGYNDLVFANSEPARYLWSAVKVYELSGKRFSFPATASFLYRHSALVNRIDLYLYRLQNKINERIIEKKLFGLGRQNRLRVFENVEWYAVHFTPDSEFEQFKKVRGNLNRIRFTVGDLKIDYNVADLTGQNKEADLFPEIYRYNLEGIAGYLKSRGWKGIFIYQAFLSEKLMRLHGKLDPVRLEGLSNFNTEAERHFISKSPARKKIMRETAERYGLGFFDAQGVFDKEENAKVYVDNCHNTDDGLEVLAAAIERVVRRTGV